MAEPREDDTKVVGAAWWPVVLAALELPPEFEPQVPRCMTAPWLLGCQTGSCLTNPSQNPLLGAGDILLGIEGSFGLVITSSAFANGMQGDVLATCDCLPPVQLARLFTQRHYHAYVLKAKELLYLPKGFTYLLAGLGEGTNLVLKLPLVGPMDWPIELHTGFEQVVGGIHDNRDNQNWAFLQAYSALFEDNPETSPPQPRDPDAQPQSVSPATASDDVPRLVW